MMTRGTPLGEKDNEGRLLSSISNGGATHRQKPKSADELLLHDKKTVNTLEARRCDMLYVILSRHLKEGSSEVRSEAAIKLLLLLWPTNERTVLLQFAVYW